MREYFGERKSGRLVTVIVFIVLVSSSIGLDCLNGTSGRLALKVGVKIWTNQSSLEPFKAKTDMQNIGCEYFKPIELVYYNPTNPNNGKPKEIFEIRFNAMERMVNHNESVLDENGQMVRYLFKAYASVHFCRSCKNLEMLVACQTIVREDQCERSFLQYNTDLEIFETVNQPKDTFANVSEKLWTGFGGVSNTNCPAKLFIKTNNSNHIAYNWTKQGTGRQISGHVVYSHPIDFWNSFKDISANGRCTEFLGPNENCFRCKTIAYFELGDGWQNNKITNAVAFYVNVDGESMVQKTIFGIARGNHSITSTRKLHMLWGVPVEETMYLEVESIPPVLYTEMIYTVYCWVSYFYFSLGTVITAKSDPSMELHISREIYMNDSRRVESSMHFRTGEGNSRKTISCFAPRMNSSEWVQDSTNVTVEESAQPEFLGNSNNLTIISELGEENRVLICSFKGNPLPSLKWSFPLPTLQNLTQIKTINLNGIIMESTLSFPPMQRMFEGSYNCTATNFRGTQTQSYRIQFPPEELSPKIKIALGISISAALMIFLSVIMLMLRKLRLEKEIYRIRTAEIMAEFREGCTIYSKDVFDEHFCILKQPYNTEFEVPLESWNIGNRVLGSGEYGLVRQGTVRIENSHIKVAIKTTKATPDVTDFKGFLDELKIMAYIGVHDNIVSLVAAFSEDNSARNILIGVEFCDNGSLLDYIKAKRGSFVNMVSAEGYITDDFNRTTVEFAALEASTMTTTLFYKWSYEIACGLEYLEYKKVLHADLASRNILLSARNDAKIGDFGLSRVLQNSGNYEKKTRCPLPWKWMALESLRYMQFSHHSDMWAYGVTLWEIFTLCLSPWSDRIWENEFMVDLENGVRLQRPLGCTHNMYNHVMLAAWHGVPQLRLRSSQAKAFFQRVLDGEYDQA